MCVVALAQACGGVSDDYQRLFSGASTGVDASADAIGDPVAPSGGGGTPSGGSRSPLAGGTTGRSAGPRTDAGGEATPPRASCDTSLDCPATQVCDPAKRRCVDCVRDHDCSEGSVCLRQQCRAVCESDKDCTPFALLCDFRTGVCGECASAGECAATEPVSPRDAGLDASARTADSYIDSETHAGADGSAAATDGSAACPGDQKICDGVCVVPGPAVGCALESCNPCPVPDHASAICTKEICDFECAAGYRRTADRLGCEVVPDAGAGGNGGAGGSGGTGGSTGACDAASCPACEGTACCKLDGTCGCFTLVLPICG